MLVKDVMTKSPKFIAANTTIVEAAKIMAEKNFGILPVIENDKIIGMLTDRDITIRVTAKNKDPKQTLAKDVMTRKVLYCYDTDSLESVLKSFGELQIHRMPVMDKNKRLVGEITLGDIARMAKKEQKLYELIGKAKELISKAA